MCPQRSLEDEVSRTTAQDLPVFAVSYLVIFLYISLALGSYTSCSRVLVSRGRGAAGGIENLPNQGTSLWKRHTTVAPPRGQLPEGPLLPDRPQRPYAELLGQVPCKAWRPSAWGGAAASPAAGG